MKLSEAVRQRAIDFMETNGEQFSVDFPVYSQAEMLEKYKISSYLYLAIKELYSLQKDKAVQAQRATEKSRKVWLEKYGVETPFNTPTARAKSAAASASPEVKAKIAATMEARYGVRSYLRKVEVHKKGIEAGHTEEALAKSRATRLQRFGVPYSLPAVVASHTPEAQRKRQGTFLRNHGTLCAWNHKKIQQTFQERYGVNCSYVVRNLARPMISKLNKDFASELMARGGKEEYAKEYAEHSDDPTWWPGNTDIAKHYGLLLVADCGATI